LGVKSHPAALAFALVHSNIGAMRRAVVPLLLCLLATPATAQQVAQVRLSYDTYAAGLEVMQMHAFLGIGPWNYRINVNYHTTGLVGLLYRGHQTNTVRGQWNEMHAEPLQFLGEGAWRGTQRRTLIDYDHGLPQIRDLQPPQQTEREPVPAELQRNTVDTLSALAQLIRTVEQGRSCETAVHTYDGRRVLDIVAHTGGAETLAPSRGSIFSGTTLRCDFEGRELAGFLLGEDTPEHRQPLHGSAWLAPMLPGTPPLPVRIAFETRWFGWATMYLTAANQASPPEVAHN
jgi:hypothetical protein